jgi:hypothetical protein
VASPVTVVGRISECLADVGHIASGGVLKVEDTVE